MWVRSIYLIDYEKSVKCCYMVFLLDQITDGLVDNFRLSIHIELLGAADEKPRYVRMKVVSFGMNPPSFRTNPSPFHTKAPGFHTKRRIFHTKLLSFHTKAL
jgi:hypothetical protein